MYLKCIWLFYKKFFKKLNENELNEKNLKSKYRKLAKIWHPDLGSGNENKMIEIIKAYEYLLKTIK